MLGVGIIGCGQISELHLAAYAGRADARVVALADVNLGAARERAEGLPVCADTDAHADYLDLLARADVDLVEILVPHHLHAQVALAALAAGKHVSLQKPMAVSLDEADALVTAAAAARSRFHVFENFLSYPPIQRAKAIVDAGEIGEISSIRLKSAAGYSEQAWPSPADRWRLDPSKCGGGPMLFDDGHHKFAIAWYFLGLPELIHCFAHQTEVGPGCQIDCPAIATWSYASGAVGSFEATYSPEMYVQTDQYPQDDRLEITGTKGIIWVTRGHGQLLSVPPVLVRAGRRTIGYEDLETDWSSSFRSATGEFLASIESGAPSLLTAEQAREVLAFSMAAQESARLGRAVSLDPTAARPTSAPVGAR
jgi:predicted dehydrogenase